MRDHNETQWRLNKVRRVPNPVLQYQIRYAIVLSFFFFFFQRLVWLRSSRHRHMATEDYEGTATTVSNFQRYYYFNPPSSARCLSDLRPVSRTGQQWKYPFNHIHDGRMYRVNGRKASKFSNVGRQIINSFKVTNDCSFRLNCLWKSWNTSWNFWKSM